MKCTHIIKCLFPVTVWSISTIQVLERSISWFSIKLSFKGSVLAGEGWQFCVVLCFNSNWSFDVKFGYLIEKWLNFQMVCIRSGFRFISIMKKWLWWKKLKNKNLETFERSSGFVFEDIDQVVSALCWEKT